MVTVNGDARSGRLRPGCLVSPIALPSARSTGARAKIASIALPFRPRPPPRRPTPPSLSVSSPQFSEGGGSEFRIPPRNGSRPPASLRRRVCVVTAERRGGQCRPSPFLAVFSFRLLHFAF